MWSTISQDKASFPPTLVVGATSRLGQMLRIYWSDHPVVWHARRERPGYLCFDPLGAPQAFAQATESTGAILCLAGVVRPDTDLSLNTDLALAAVRASAAGGRQPVLLCSSAAVYGAGGAGLSEEDDVQPISAYGQAKRAMEHAALAEGDRLGVQVTALRIGNVAGADAILGGWTPGFLLDQFPDGSTPARSYIGPSAFSSVLARLLAAADQLPDVLNLALPGSVQMGALLDAADLAWSPRPAGQAALAQVELDTARLSQLGAIDTRRCDAQAIVADWRSWDARKEQQ